MEHTTHNKPPGTHGVCFSSEPPALWNCTGKYARATSDCPAAADVRAFVLALLVLCAAAAALAGATVAFFWLRARVVERLERARRARAAGPQCRAAAAAAEAAARRARREQRRTLRRVAHALNSAETAPLVATPPSDAASDVQESSSGSSMGGSYAAPLCISQDIGELGRYTHGSSEDDSDPFNAPPEVRARLAASQQLHDLSAPLL